ncbi:bestrophin family protein [Fischerella sp. PCC 9605]|uniref:bestrophin family protein n=1 Tax=Fischerella sp. PCC 9605 TaxID=1173024 RepID=UPI0004B89D0E|nr:bestrophin family ion channel [Fischerella sp. PCC 9605]
MVVRINKDLRSDKKQNLKQKNKSPRFLKPRSQKHSRIRNIVNSRSFQEKFRIYTGEKLHWHQVILRLKGTVIPAVLPWMLLCGGYAFLVSVAEYFGYLSSLRDIKSLPNVILSLNIVLSLLLAFRTNTAHERFWEGRKLWGAMVNVVRNLARSIWIFIEEREPHEQETKAATVRLVAAFAVAMKLHLRREPVNSELAPFMSQDQYHTLQQVNHSPLQIAFWIGDYLQQQYESERVNVYQLSDLQKMLNDMVDILGGCERILKTPVPLVYTITLKSLLVIYFLVMPLGLVHDLGWWTGLDMSFISLLLLGIDEIGSEIEEPFGHDPSDLPLDFICKTIANNVEELISKPSQVCQERLSA